MKNHYQELRDRQQEEVNAFPMFFAFDQRQFAEGMRRLGLRPSDMNQVYAIAGTGGFYRKSDAPKLHEMFARHRKELDEAIAADKAGDNHGQNRHHGVFQGVTGSRLRPRQSLGARKQHIIGGQRLRQLRAGKTAQARDLREGECQHGRDHTVKHLSRKPRSARVRQRIYGKRENVELEGKEVLHQKRIDVAGHGHKEHNDGTDHVILPPVLFDRGQNPEPDTEGNGKDQRI